jgi:hypothetical protein
VWGSTCRLEISPTEGYDFEKGLSVSTQERRERIRPTGNIDGIETNSPDPNQDFVLACFGDWRFFENDIFFLKMWFEVVSFPSVRYEPLV